MADITITIPTAQVARVSEALGATTIPEAKAWVIDQIKQAVVVHEQKQTSDTEQAKVESAEQARRVALEAVQATVESEITLS